MPLTKIIFKTSPKLHELINMRTSEDKNKGSLFMTQTQIDSYCLHLRDDGKLCFKDNIPLDSSLNIKGKMKDNPFKFIITLNGEIIAAPKFDAKGNKIQGSTKDAKTPPSLKHSTLCQGEPALFGGAFICQAGKIVKITHESGHYLPNIDSFYQVLKFFEQIGVISCDLVRIGRCFPLTMRKEPTMFWVKGLPAFEKRFAISEERKGSCRFGSSNR